MKSKLSILWALIAVVCAIALAGCMTEGPSSSAGPNSTSVSMQMDNQGRGVSGEMFNLPVKDFESRGLIFVEIKFKTDFDGSISGNLFTYNALLKEAQRVGADAIINVTIDKQTETVTARSSAGTSRSRQETWYGSALAIKYTTALKVDNLSQGAVQAQSAPSSAPASSQPVTPASAVRGFLTR